MKLQEILEHVNCEYDVDIEIVSESKAQIENLSKNNTIFDKGLTGTISALELAKVLAKASGIKQKYTAINQKRFAGSGISMGTIDKLFPKDSIRRVTNGITGAGLREVIQHAFEPVLYSQLNTLSNYKSLKKSYPQTNWDNVQESIANVIEREWSDNPKIQKDIESAALEGESVVELNDELAPGVTLLDYLSRYATERIARDYTMKPREYPTNIARRREYMKDLQHVLKSFGAEISNYEELVTDVTSSGYDEKESAYVHDRSTTSNAPEDTEQTYRDEGLPVDSIRQDVEDEWKERGAYDELTPTISTKTRKSKKRK